MIATLLIVQAKVLATTATYGLKEMRQATATICNVSQCRLTSWLTGGYSFITADASSPADRSHYGPDYLLAKGTRWDMKTYYYPFGVNASGI